jgi:hypothetical protein
MNAMLRLSLSRWLLAALLLAALPAGASSLQQSFTLQPGWNAIWVELEPDQNEIARVFAGLPVASVWRFMPSDGTSQFIRDPSEGLENLEGWFGWFPEPRPEAFLSSLFRINANTAYLVKLDGTSSRQLTITGKPRYRTLRWQPNGFTLTGLPVAASNGPSFAEFFSASPSHQAQPVYRLLPGGQWQLVTDLAGTAIQSGQAYWIHTKGNSRYQGRMQLVLEQSDAIEFSAALEEIRLVLRNRSGSNGSFQIERLGGAIPLPLAFRNEDPETGEVGWPVLQDVLVLDAPVDTDVFVTLAVLRRDFTEDRMEQTLAITDEHGQRLLIQAGGSSVQPGAAARRAGLKSGATGFAGLWVGEVSIDAVSQAQQAGTTPTSTARSFDQRFIIHVNGAGQAKLLKDVIQMWEDGTSVPSASDPGFNEVDQPGRFVLLTNKSLIGLYSGAALRDGVPVGLRISSVAYDFEGETLDFNGSFGPGGQLSATVAIGTTLPTNPFLHRYHPDHDNLDAEFLNFRAEAYQVVRSMQFTFTQQDPLGRNPPGWGDSIVGGRFAESITGLHKNAIFTSGQFRLRRVSAVPTLNQ